VMVLDYAIYIVPLLLLWLWFGRQRTRTVRRSIEAKSESLSAGLMEPPSLHPIIDPSRCIGCGSCVQACPEQPHHHVLGLINGKAELVSPSDCIGHGACRTACPVAAITLVFGTEKRGIDIPVLSPQFESNVPGVFVAGELGGMGLIRNALEQGKQAVDMIERHRPRGGTDMLDLVIVGAGPAGFAASLSALSKHLKFVTLEQESLGGCVFQYPRGKLVMTQAATLPIIGKVNFTRTSKEELLEFWRSIEKKSGVQINYNERVEGVQNHGDKGFLVKTPRGEYRARNVLLAIGRRGTPRKLGVPGEDLPKVVYRLIDPEQYTGQHVLVVGGGDSALEAAASIAEIGNTRVTLSYRGDAFDRAKPKNRERVAAAARSGELDLRLGSTVRQIAPDHVLLDQKGTKLQVANHSVIVNAGGVLPNDFLRQVGVAVETKYGTA
jgi:thioredoxin reductase (NADPH)